MEYGFTILGVTGIQWGVSGKMRRWDPSGDKIGNLTLGRRRWCGGMAHFFGFHCSYRGREGRCRSDLVHYLRVQLCRVGFVLYKGVL